MVENLIKNDKKTPQTPLGMVLCFLSDNKNTFYSVSEIHNEIKKKYNYNTNKRTIRTALIELCHSNINLKSITLRLGILKIPTLHFTIKKT